MLSPLLVVVWWLSACEPPASLEGLVTDADIPVLRNVDFVYDESQLQIESERELDPRQLSVVTAVSRAGTRRFIESRSTKSAETLDGVLTGSLALHIGWRQEFFAMGRGPYEMGDALPPGDALYLAPDDEVLDRDMGKGWLIRRRSDFFTGLITRIIDVPQDGYYTFRADSDDGSLGTLQDLTKELHQVRLLWYDWYNHPMDGRLAEATGQFLERGAYLLTVHFYENEEDAGYWVQYSRDDADPLTNPGG
jgi:hypothetical protein